MNETGSYDAAALAALSEPHSDTLQTVPQRARCENCGWGYHPMWIGAVCSNCDGKIVAAAVTPNPPTVEQCVRLAAEVERLLVFNAELDRERRFALEGEAKAQTALEAEREEFESFRHNAAHAAKLDRADVEAERAEALKQRDRALAEAAAYREASERGAKGMGAAMTEGMENEEKLEAEAAALRKALEDLLTRMDEMEKPLNDLATFRAIHGIPYTGPNWGEPYKAARSALQSGAGSRLLAEHAAELANAKNLAQIYYEGKISELAANYVAMKEDRDEQYVRNGRITLLEHELTDLRKRADALARAIDPTSETPAAERPTESLVALIEEERKDRKSLDEVLVQLKAELSEDANFGRMVELLFHGPLREKEMELREVRRRLDLARKEQPQLRMRLQEALAAYQMASDIKAAVCREKEEIRESYTLLESALEAERLANRGLTATVRELRAINVEPGISLGQAQEWREALKRYGRHASGCDLNEPCSCGLDAALGVK